VAPIGLVKQRLADEDTSVDPSDIGFVNLTHNCIAQILTKSVVGNFHNEYLGAI
jgi:hypothetical protein